MLPNYRVILSPRVFRELDELLDYIAKDAPANAAQEIDRLYAAIQSLSALPHRYGIVQGRRKPASAVHRMPVPPYLAYYRVDANQYAVRIITLRHGARRQPRRFD